LLGLLPASPAAGAGIEVGTVVGLTHAGEPLVDWGGAEARPARSLVALPALTVGRSVAVAFLHGDGSRPLILGVLAEPPAPHSGTLTRAEVDGDRLVLTAEREIVLRCGEASITLTRAGKVLIRGACIISRSSGVNSIKGASVQIN
jgi:hypothetical protein